MLVGIVGGRDNDHPSLKWFYISEGVWCPWKSGIILLIGNYSIENWIFFSLIT